MASSWPVTNPRKRKRRRGLNRPAISAQLFLDERLKGDYGVLSEDLFNDLFPSLPSFNEEENAPKWRHVAIAPRSSPSSEPDAVSWTILAVKKHDVSATKKQPQASSLTFSASSNALQPFVEMLRKDAMGRSISTIRSPIDIHVLDTVAITLDTIFVTLDGPGLAKIEETNQQFNYIPHWRGESTSAVGLNSTGEGRRRSSSGMTRPNFSSSRWEGVVRQALKIPSVIHAGDLLPLPLPSHPITHKPPPPAKVTLCEPVSQGLLHSETRVVITQTRDHVEQRSPTIITFPTINGLVEEEEDSSNEQFHSATEDKGESIDSSPVPPARKRSSFDELDTDKSDQDDEDDDLSDGSGDTVGLTLPTLPTQASGMASAFTSATPRLGLGQMNGIATPGSILSGFSTATSRGNRSKGRVFEAQGLLDRIPDVYLLPKPSADDDEEARVFIDTASLVKIGCFSGDWVRLESTADTKLNTLSSWGLGAFDSAVEEPSDWRAAKVFALPSQFSQAVPRYAINRSGSRRGSFSSIRSAPLTPKVHVSPLLLSNLSNPSHLRICSLAQSHSQNPFSRAIPRTRITSTSVPPFAKEVTLVRVSTPLATERNLQSILLFGLRNYFEHKRRVVKNGDIFGIPLDESLGKALYQGNAGEEENEQGDLMSKIMASSDASKSKPTTSSVAWFKIRSVAAEVPKGEPEPDENMWGGIAIVRPGYTGMVQAGSEQGKLPEAMNNSWQYYLGAKRRVSNSRNHPTSMEFAGRPRQHISQMRRRLRELISAATSPQAIHLGLPPLAILLASTQRHIGKATTALNACVDLGLHIFNIDSYDILTEGGSGGGDVKTEAFLKARAERALTCGAEFTALLIQHIDVLNADRMAGALGEILADSRVLIATTTDVDKVPEGIRGIFTHELELTAPDEAEREGLLRDIIQDSGILISPTVDLSSVAIKTAALVAGDLVDVVERAVVARKDRLEHLATTASQRLESEDLQVTVRDVEIAGGDASRSVIKSDFDVAVDAARKNFADAIGAPKIPNVTWDDVGGLTNIKDAVMETIQLPLERPELFAKGMKKRSGILFYGPPGTGKTLLAKAIATEFSLNFFSIKGPELLNMYIGESEANVRRVFQRARDARPCVVFFDELDSVAPKRGNQGDSGGVMDRIVSQLLAELDGMSNGEDGSGGGVFVIGATNRPDLLDQALLRPGRFDKMLYLGVSDTHEGQLTILKALTRKFALHPNTSLTDVASTLPFTFTGADLYALCSDAMLKAITRRSDAVDAKIKRINAKRATEGQGAISTAYFFDHLSTAEDTEVVVEEADFAAALRELVPSVSAKELEHYQRVKSAFEQRDNKDGQTARPRSGHSELRQVQQPLAPNAKGKGKAVNGNDDDLVFGTDQLSLGESTNGLTKGKGKARQPAPDHMPSAADFGFQDASAADDEAMYE